MKRIVKVSTMKEETLTIQFIVLFEHVQIQVINLASLEMLIASSCHPLTRSADLYVFDPVSWTEGCLRFATLDLYWDQNKAKRTWGQHCTQVHRVLRSTGLEVF